MPPVQRLGRSAPRGMSPSSMPVCPDADARGCAHASPAEELDGTDHPLPPRGLAIRQHGVVRFPAAAKALAEADSLGPFFAVSATAEPTWASWVDLIDGPALDTRICDVTTTLTSGSGSTTVDPRIAASITHLGLVARLLSPLLGAALTSGVLPVVDPSEVHLLLTGPNPLPLAFHATEVVVANDAPTLVRALDDAWLRPAVHPLSARLVGSAALSRRVLDGNVASAVVGALRLASAARPGLAPAAEAVVDAVLSEGSLAGTGRRRLDGSFIRRSCCLFYRLPGAGTCGDCVLATSEP